MAKRAKSKLEIEKNLHLIEDLLVLMKGQRNLETWSEVERFSHTTFQAVQRLRKAWNEHEIDIVTLSLANHFKEQDAKEKDQTQKTIEAERTALHRD